ncbi:type IV toxin-antitoxin system AbiEi family antitoxin domain-containing protein [Blastococcus sp. CT_GayMR20]|uniref:type IV toxin-antitoxin system AbiEi family antitoxin domain-containing protein n=1 Tax=Blastococcus sp. CT_GayMR20 TaxID=2559609 RepID=UPI001FD7C973|nr:type IV toxin-antitoxin system AbiEi family antitoxin domain-containing protein [Blastococcus sp. CT_GayMR20]
MHPILQSVAALRFGVFTSQESLTAGYALDDIKSALRSGRWLRLRKGVYVSRDRLEAADDRERHLMDCVAVLLSLQPGPVLSHSSAARLHRLLVPRVETRDVRVTSVDQWRRGRGYRVARAALPPDDVVPWLTYRTTTVARTLVDCAREWSQLQAVVAMDAALNDGLVRRAELQDAVHSARHRTGASAAARALGLSDGRAESPLETEGRLALLAAGLPTPELQVELHNAHGFVARVDAWYEDAALALEFDGRVKYLDPRDCRTPGEVLWEEKRREDRVRGLDVRFVRIAKADLGGSWPGVAAGIARLLATPYTGPRRYTVVRRREPGADAEAA